MKFFTRRRRQPPAIIIISLIDILIVLLIFLMVTTTFKQRPSVKIALPQSRQAKPGASEDHLVVSLAAQAPNYYLGARAVTYDKLRQEFAAAVARKPEVKLVIEADGKSTWEHMLRVLDAAKEAKFKENPSVTVRQPGR